MQPKGGVTLIITVGGGNPPSCGSSVDSKKEGDKMIKVPMEALVSETEGGEALSPAIGDSVVLDSVEGEVVAVNEDGTAHVQIKTAGGVPVEYVEDVIEEVPLDADALDAEEAALDAEGDELLAAAEAVDEEALF
jgi:hypothetical protein|tara:strand:+ start:351 stop:755 length:405 start_codon:yes stop_codon:yes gene_type:complete